MGAARTWPWIVLAFTMAMMLPMFAAGPPLADFVFVNGKFWTVDPARPQADAIAIRGDRILAVGRQADLISLVPAANLVDLGGQRVVPGFYDSHIHLLGSGLQLEQVALKDAKDEAEFGKRLADFDRKLPRDRWMLGGEWDHDRTFAGVLPTAELIDRYVASRPVFLRRYDGHMAVVNSQVLKLAGITAETPDPPGGVIFRKPNSKEPSGVLRDNAMDLVDRLIPAPTESAILEAVLAAQAEARRFGVTSAQDMDGSDEKTRRTLFQTYQTLARAGRLTVRVDLRWPLAQWQELANLGLQANFGDAFVRIGGVKGFVDGSLGSSTAKMFEPYVHESNQRGVWVTSREKLREWIQGADRAGLSVAVHAIGDEANATLLDIFDEVRQVNGPRDRRFRIEHAQHLRPKDFPRFAALDVIASMQPFHVIDDGRWAEGRIGKNRCASSYAFASLLAAKARVAFGSDWSVAPLNPLVGIDAAVNRRTLDGKDPNGWFPEQRIGVAEAIESYTLASAYAGFQERERGSLSPGKLADFVVLDRDILDAAERDRIAETQVLMTVLGGKIVFQRKP